MHGAAPTTSSAATPSWPPRSDRAEHEPAERDRDRLRQEIVPLFRDTEAAIEELAALQGGASARWWTDTGRSSASRRLPARRPGRGTRARDHLGSSTFVERGLDRARPAASTPARRASGAALELAPGEPARQTLLGWAPHAPGPAPRRRRSLLEAVLQPSPTTPSRAPALGYVCLPRGRFAEAIELLSRVLCASRQRPQGHPLRQPLPRAWCYAGREMHRDARGSSCGAPRARTQPHRGVLGARPLATTVEGDRGHAADAWRRGAAQANRFNPWGERCGGRRPARPGARASLG